MVYLQTFSYDSTTGIVTVPDHLKSPTVDDNISEDKERLNPAATYAVVVEDEKDLHQDIPMVRMLKHVKVYIHLYLLDIMY